MYIQFTIFVLPPPPPSLSLSVCLSLSLSLDFFFLFSLMQCFSISLHCHWWLSFECYLRERNWSLSLGFRRSSSVDNISLFCIFCGTRMSFSMQLKSQYFVSVLYREVSWSSTRAGQRRGWTTRGPTSKRYVDTLLPAWACSLLELSLRKNPEWWSSCCMLGLLGWRWRSSRDPRLCCWE